MAGKAKEKEETDTVEEPDDKAEPKEAAEPKVKEDDDGVVTVQLEEPKPRKTRKERREEYPNEEARRWREQAEAVQARLAATEAQLHARLNQVESRIPQGQDPYEGELAKIRRQQELIQNHIRSGAVTSEQQLNDYRQQFYELESHSRKLDRDRIKRELADEMRREQQPKQGEYEEAALRNEFPDVIQHNQAMGYARGVYYQLVAEGKPPTLTTSREAMTRAAERFQLRQQAAPAPSASQQARYGAVPAQAAPKNGRSEVRLDSSQKKMALARWPKDDENVAYTKMAAVLAKAAEDEREA